MKNSSIFPSQWLPRFPNTFFPDYAFFICHTVQQNIAKPMKKYFERFFTFKTKHVINFLKPTLKLLWLVCFHLKIVSQQINTFSKLRLSKYFTILQLKCILPFQLNTEQIWNTNQIKICIHWNRNFKLSALKCQKRQETFICMEKNA